MFYDQKCDRILELLETQPYWTSKALSQKLGVSRSTVQRCLEDLHRTGRAKRIHGGVRRIDVGVGFPVPLNERSRMDTAAKETIGRRAMALLGESGYVYLDAGTSILPLAQSLDKAQHRAIHFVTNDVSIALVLARQELSHTLLSGRIHPVTQTISGPASLAQISEFHFDTCFISADGIDSLYGVTCLLNDEACLKCQAMRQSTTKVLLAASGKWGQRFGSRIGSLDRFDSFITEKATASMRKGCRAKGLNLIVAGDGQK